ncbi:MAG: hypothetical protein EOO43_13335 [Flavobacterium sp.]|nr:MAG: hypothetical protein EOO43_13335 [Flavobacterium sp.]
MPSTLKPVILPDFIGLVIRPIQKGQELLVHYGYDYWITETMCGKLVDVYNATKMAFFSFSGQLNWNKKVLAADATFKQFLTLSRLERFKEYKGEVDVDTSITDDRKLQSLALLCTYMLHKTCSL